MYYIMLLISLNILNNKEYIVGSSIFFFVKFVNDNLNEFTKKEIIEFPEHTSFSPSYPKIHKNLNEIPIFESKFSLNAK